MDESLAQAGFSPFRVPICAVEGAGSRPRGASNWRSGSSIDAVAERVNALSFVVEGLMTVDYDEVHEIY
jgi:hypothetical protein